MAVFKLSLFWVRGGGGWYRYQAVLDCAATTRDLLCGNSTNKKATKFVSRSLRQVTFSIDT